MRVSRLSLEGSRVSVDREVRGNESYLRGTHLSVSCEASKLFSTAQTTAKSIIGHARNLDKLKNN